MLLERFQAFRHVAVQIRGRILRIVKVAVPTGDLYVAAIGRETGKTQEARTAFEVVGGTPPRVPVPVIGGPIYIGYQFLGTPLAPGVRVW